MLVIFLKLQIQFSNEIFNLNDEKTNTTDSYFYAVFVSSFCPVQTTKTPSKLSNYTFGDRFNSTPIFVANDKCYQ
ncbi:hypothetical protein GCM10027035_27610 [Emticicia sediminis]